MLPLFCPDRSMSINNVCILIIKIKEHHTFMSINMAINSNRDIESESQVVYVEKQRVFVKDTDNGKQIAEEINDLMNLLKVYNS